VLKLGSEGLDQALSARPLAQEIAGVEMHRLPLAVYHVRRELEYGLTFLFAPANFQLRLGAECHRKSICWWRRKIRK